MWSTISADKDHIMGNEALQHFLFCQNIRMINAEYWSFSQSQLLEKRDLLQQGSEGWVGLAAFL
jgi:hypothetical protein